jgi:hypothetical protein
MRERKCVCALQYCSCQGNSRKIFANLFRAKQDRLLEPIPVGRVSCGGGDLCAEQGVATRHSELWQGAATQCRAQSAPPRRLGLLE